MCARHAAGARRRGCQAGPSRRPRARTFPRRPEHEIPLGQRQPCTAAGPSRHRRPGGRRTSLRGRRGQHPRSAKRAWKAEESTGCRPGRPSVFIPRDSEPPSPARDPCCHPSALRPGRPPPAAGPRRRPPAFDTAAYRQRNTVERCINRLKQWRGLAMRTDKLALSYQAAFHFAAILVWARR
jgi:hypothetical protein